LQLKEIEKLAYLALALEDVAHLVDPVSIATVNTLLLNAAAVTKVTQDPPRLYLSDPHPSGQIAQLNPGLTVQTKQNLRMGR
jgi:hypothetical protein